MKITLYTTHCPKCKVLEEKLNNSDLEYSVCEDMNALRSKYPEIDSVPQLEVVNPNGETELMGFAKANSFINGHIVHRLNG